ncbi:MAG: glycosyltransferase, partial [Planctomycetes bacterium]|nr:glycosyltransferase [Planctomycetota bacterium]
MPHILYGPSDNPTLYDRFLTRPVTAGRWTLFSATCPSWDHAVAQTPAIPDAVLVSLGYNSAPAWVWSAPAPVVALAVDSNLLWHGYRHVLPHADLVLTDAPSASRLRRTGLETVRAANLFGLDRHFLDEIDTPEVERPIDVLFVGNLSPAVQRKRAAWLSRLKRLSGRYRVQIASGVHGAEYRTLLRQAKLVFNHAIRGECNLRALEAAASGAVLLQEADNVETRDYLEPGTEYAPYTPTDFEPVVEQLLGDTSERERIANRARKRVRGYSFDSLIESALGLDRPEWDVVRERAAKRMPSPPAPSLAGRVWQRVSVAGPDADPTLRADVVSAGDHHSLAVMSGSSAEAEKHLAIAADAGNRVSTLGRAVALGELGRTTESVELLRTLVASLSTNAGLSPSERDAVPYPVVFDSLRVEWERAGYDHPDDRSAEWAAKGNLLRWRANALLGARTGELSAFEAAVAARPDLPATRAALGRTLARIGRIPEAIEHLQFATEHDPHDADAATLLTTLREPARLAPPQAKPAPAAIHPVQKTRFVTLSRDEFTTRFGTIDASRALSGFTPPQDTVAVLTLVTRERPRRVLEIGTALGQMTANLTAFTPPDATVFSLGIVGEGPPPASTNSQEYEIPRRDQFARFLNHFGTGYKAQLITADSRAFDFSRLGMLDFVFVDGGHEAATVRSDSLNSYQSLRSGGCLVWHDLPSPVTWVEVEKAVSELGLPEPVYQVAGTGVAFLFKGEGLQAQAGADTPRVAIAWDGEFSAVHSLASVNRGICSELVARGQDVSLNPGSVKVIGATPFELPVELISRLGRALPGAVTVRHRWPPDFTPPPGGLPFVLYHPWEFGRIPRAWVEPILNTIDEVWAYSRSVLRAYVASGVPEDRVALVPPGVDLDQYRPDLEPLPLKTTKSVKLLFVGGTIPRKGIDILLAAYGQAFRRADDVVLVIKDVGVGTFYRDQTAEQAIEQFRNQSNSPEIVHLTHDLSESDLARLYATCDVLVHPYRGEGFALPVLEAMSCGRPVIVTAGGPTDDFVPPAAGWRIPARLSYFAEERVGDLPTVGRPWLLEPDVRTLTEILRVAVTQPEERVRRGQAARRAVMGWSWSKSAAIVEDRVRVLRARTPIRFRRSMIPATVLPTQSPPPPPAQVPAFLPPGKSMTIHSDEPVIVVAPDRAAAPVPAVAKLPPRVSLTMIVKNEEHNIGDCLTTVRDLVDEVVVIDTGSTDRTREIAGSFGVVLGEFPWIDHFAAARNAALERATGDYAFWMDADDRLDADNRRKLKTLFANLTGGNDAYVMKCLCVPDKPGAGGTVVDHVRLFRHVPQHRWTFRVHEQILPALRNTQADVRWSDVVVRHVGYVDRKLRRTKLDRDLRLLKIDEQENPHSSFNLFNLGCVYRELGEYEAAISVLEKSLALSHPKDSIVRKLYAMLVQCHGYVKDPRKAAEILEAGRKHYPEDAELLFLAGNLAKDRRQWREAETFYRQLIDGSDGQHFASVDSGLRAVRGRHNLAVLLLDQGREAEAEGVWRAVLVVDPHFLPAHIGLGEVYLKTGNAAGVHAVIETLRGMGTEAQSEAVNLEARWRLSQKDHAGAAARLEDAVKQYPGALSLRITLSHARLADGSSPEVLEAALRSILEIDPNNTQARHNLQVLMRNTGRWIEGV